MFLLPRLLPSLAAASLFCLVHAITVRAAESDDEALRTRCRQVLQHELTTTTSWVRVHAAEALIEHGLTDGIANLFAADLPTATPPYRIGVWRVLARSAADPAERAACRERIRRALHDPTGPDRVHAIETLAKLGAASAADRGVIDTWLATADASTSAYLRWLDVQLSDASARPAAESALAALLHSDDVAARARAAYAFTRLAPLARETVARLTAAALAEPADSKARVNLLTAAFVHAPATSTERPKLKALLLRSLESGTTGEQFEIAPALGRQRDRSDLPRLVRLLDAKESDTRIGAASGLLYLLR